MLKVLSLGAGVQSTCVLLMSSEGVLPTLDAAVFACTQWEPRSVYEHLNWLAGVPFEEVPGSNGRRHRAIPGVYRGGVSTVPVHVATAGDLRADALDFRQERKSGDGKRHASMPQFVKNPDGTRGIVRRQCTGTYKREVIERVVRRDLLSLKRGQKAPADALEAWLGISADEPQRIRSGRQNHWSFVRCPLVTDVAKLHPGELFASGYTRQDCLDWLAQHGYPTPPRSACIGCPFHRDAEWRAMKRDRPEEFADAVEFDRDSRRRSAAGQEQHKERLAGRRVGLPFLHDSLVPLDEAAFNRDPAKQFGFDEECQGHCGV